MRITASLIEPRKALVTYTPNLLEAVFLRAVFDVRTALGLPMTRGGVEWVFDGVTGFTRVGWRELRAINKAVRNDNNRPAVAVNQLWTAKERSK